MTRRRLRWIAVQAIVVTVLAVVVVVTLLQPESQVPLSGISGGESPPIAQGPGDGPAGVDDGRDGGGNGRGEDRDEPRNDADGGQGDTPAPTGTASTSVGGTPPLALTDPPATSPVRPEGLDDGEDEGDEDGGSPSDDQYSDTLGALDSALGE